MVPTYWLSLIDFGPTAARRSITIDGRIANGGKNHVTSKSIYGPVSSHSSTGDLGMEQVYLESPDQRIPRKG